MSAIPAVSALAARQPQPPPHDHFVHFYDTDATLTRDVGQFLRNGLACGAGAILIATPEHRESIVARWTASGFSVEQAEANGRLVLLDARSTLDRLVRDGKVDEALFDAVVGKLIRSMAGRFDEIAAFGEMVALLWQDNRPEEAVRLEEFWNRLSAKHSLALYCAYPMSACAETWMAEPFRAVCAAHSHVVAADALHDMPEAQRVRWMAEMQQKAASLPGEMIRRQHAEARLAEREHELRDFVENGPVALHRVGPDGTILWANRTELEMLGYARDEYVGRNVADFHVDRQVAARMLETLARSETLRDYPALLRRKDGSVRHVLVTSNALVVDGRLVHTRCYTRDITERWLAQEALRERSAILTLALQGARMGYWVGDMESGRMKIGPELADLLDLPSPMEMPLDDFVALAHQEERASFRRAIDDAVATRGRFECRFRVRRGAGWLPLQVRGDCIHAHEPGSTRFYGVCWDATDRATGEAPIADPSV